MHKYDPRSYENYKRNIMKQYEFYKKIDNYSASVLTKERNLNKNQNDLCSLAILNKYSNEMMKINIRNKTISKNLNNKYDKITNYYDNNHPLYPTEKNSFDERLKGFDYYNKLENKTIKNNYQIGIRNRNSDLIENFQNNANIFQDNSNNKNCKININESSSSSLIIDDNNNNNLHESQEEDLRTNMKRSSSLHNNNKQLPNIPIIIDFKKEKNHQILEQLEEQNKALANLFEKLENKERNSEIDYEQEYESLEKDYLMKNNLQKIKSEVFKLANRKIHHKEIGAPYRK